MSKVNSDKYYSLSLNNRKCMSFDLQFESSEETTEMFSFCVLYWPNKWETRLQHTDSSTPMSLSKNGTDCTKGYL